MRTKCPLYADQEETANHLFIICSYTKLLWNQITCRLHVHFNSRTKFELWREQRKSLSNLITPKAWDFIVGSLCWALWKERNRRIFRFEAFSPNATYSHFISTTQEWMFSYQGPYKQNLTKALSLLKAEITTEMVGAQEGCRSESYDR